MFKNRIKGVDVARATKITPSTISRYLSGTHQPTSENLIAISEYLGVSPEALLSSSEASESSVGSRYIPTDKDKIIAVQEELIQKFKQENEELRQKIKDREEPKSREELKAKWKTTNKAKADQAIAKNKSTLRIKTTRKRKK